MPCNDGGFTRECYECESLQKKLDKVTRIACHLIRNGAPVPDFAISWWTAHQEVDRKREKREKEEKRKKALKRAALKKLTKEEKELLGL